MEESTQAEIFTEEQLKRMSRHIKTTLPLSQNGRTRTDHIKLWRETAQSLLSVASRADVGATHRVAAWNTLCAVIDQCANGADTELQYNTLWRNGLWYRLLQLYLSQSQNARPKSSKQLLSTLSSSWLRTESSLKSEVQVVTLLLDTILETKDDRRTKAALQVLSHFLSKDVICLHTLLRCRIGGEELPSSRGERSMLQDFLTNLFLLASQRELGSITGQLVAVLLDRFDLMLSDKNTSEGASDIGISPLWAIPLAQAMKSSTFSTIELRLHVFPVLFKRRLGDFFGFLHSEGLDDLVQGSLDTSLDSQSREILYATLQSGKELGLLQDTDEEHITQTSSYMSIPVHAIARLLRSHSSTARLTSLSFLVSSHSSTRPVSGAIFRVLQRYLHILMGDTDANFRSEVFSLMQKLMGRLRAVTYALQRQAEEDSSAALAIEQSHAFLRWLLRFFRSELRPTANYQHHISALRCLSAMTRSGVDKTVPNSHLSKSAAIGASRWPFNIAIMTPALKRLLLNLLVDPFDDVRQTSFSILSTYAGVHIEGDKDDSRCQLVRTMGRAESSMLASGRADQADGVAHLYALQYRNQDDTSAIPGSDLSSRQLTLLRLVEGLEHMLEIAKSSLATAASKYPLHGLLTSLRYVIAQSECQYDFDNIPQRLGTCLRRLWEVVLPILCNDAPEGHLPEDTRDTAEITTKDTLSYCWRALKESSLLLATIVADRSTSDEQVRSLSELCFTQLAELRHRGAFSTVAQTWTVCCLRCHDMKQGEGRLADVWFDRIVRILDERTIINTRRSAGLPSLICGLLIADETGDLMVHTFKDFTAIARQPVDVGALNESSLPQVHTLNCIKDILKNTRLGEQSERYIAHSLILAAESLRSKAWAVRNCGLMLFRAVIDRLLGTSEAHLDDDRSTGSRIDIDQHPDLLPTVVDLLRAPVNAESSGSEGIFPALKLLQNMELPHELRLQAREVVYKLTVASSWHIRQKAARVFSIISERNQPPRKIENVLESITSSANAHHGALLCLKQLLVQAKAPKSNTQALPGSHTTMERQRSSHVEVETLKEAIGLAVSLYHRTTSSVIKSECIEVCAEWSRISNRNIQLGNDVSRILSEERTLPDPHLDFAGELNRMSYSPSSGDPILRRSIASALVTEAQTSKGRTGELRASLLSLQHSDVDACATFFEELQRMDISGCMTSSLLELLLEIVADILGGHLDMHLKCVGQEFLLHVHDQGFILRDAVSEFCDAIATSTHPVWTEANQRYADNWLQLQALALDYWASIDITREGDQTHSQQLQYWLLSCCTSVEDDQNALYCREAASLAISRISSLWTYLYHTDLGGFQRLSLASYDLLNDDDEDIRTHAAQISHRVVHVTAASRGDGVLEPTEARSTLTRFFIDQWSNDSAFAEEAVNRAFGLGANLDVAIAQRLEKASNIDTALFAEEKQNLYVDEAVEAKTWSAVLLRLQPSSIPSKRLCRLAHWISDGLDVLLKKALEEVDGPLGWSSKPEVFVLGLQIIYGVEVLMHASSNSRRLPVRPSVIRRKLARLLSAMDKAGTSDLWQREIDRVIGKTMVGSFTSTATVLGAVLQDLYL